MVRPWLCEIRHMWEGSPSEPEIRKEMTMENGEVSLVHGFTQKS